MYIILGASGHVGSAVAQTLLDKGESVTVITHDPKKGDHWQQQGANVVVADVYNEAQLRQVFQQGERLFLLNPPAAPSTDTAQEERKSVNTILSALKDSGLEKIVAQSTYGAQPGDRIGDLGVLYELEQGLAKTGIPTSILRAAYYMTNWDASLQSAQKEGKVHTFYPVDFKLPMVAPQDLGTVAAQLLQKPVNKTGLYYVEGPEAYSSADVAQAFASALGKPVEAEATPREQWIPAMQSMGFSPEAAESMATMTGLTLEGPDFPDDPIRGQTTLDDYITQLVSKG